MEFKEILLKIKYINNVSTDRELAKKLGLTEDAIRNWKRKKKVPKKYLKLLEEKNINNNNVNNSGIMVNGVNNGKLQIHNHTYELDNKLCDLIKELSPKRKEYYFYKISAELLEDER